MTASTPQGADPERWLDEHGDYLLNLAWSRLRDRQIAEDLVQETLLSALNAVSGFEGRSSERTWLVAILKRKIIDHLRRVFRDAPQDPSETAADVELDGYNHSGAWAGHWAPGVRPVDWDDDPSQLLERKEFWEILDRCLKNLPPRLAAVFVLCEIEEMPSAEACKELAITPSNLWVMLHRARHRLRQCMEKNWMGRDDN